MPTSGKAKNKRICAVGTTVMRTLESSISTKNEALPFEGWTNLFLFPPHNFKIANCMLTNFHLPQSALMMQVAAFTGLDMLKPLKEGIRTPLQWLLRLMKDIYLFLGGKPLDHS